MPETNSSNFIKLKLAPITFGSKIAWIEVGLWLLVIYGAILGTLKRYLPIPQEFITIGFDLLCFVLLGYVMARRLKRSRKIPYSPLSPQLFLFMGFAFVTILNPILTSFTRGMIGWRFLASGILFHFLGFYAFDDIRRLRRFFKVFWLVTAMVAFYGIIQLIRGYTAVELIWIDNLAATMRIAGTGRYRLMATMGGAVDLGFFMVLAITSLIGVVIAKKRLNISFVFLLSLTLTAIIFTFVRTAWVAVFVGVLYMLALNFWHIKRLRPLFPVFAFFLMIIFIVLPLFASYIAPQFENPALQERIASLSNPLADNSMLDRYETWANVWQLVQEYPFGIGVGMTGATTLRFPDNPGPAGVTMDNSYLKVLVEMGWIGLILFVYLLISVLVKGGYVYKSLYKLYKVDALPLLGCFVAFIVMLFFGEYIELNPSRTIIWIFTGFLFSLPRLQRIAEENQ